MKKCGSTKGTGDPIPCEKKGGSGDEAERPAGVSGMRKIITCCYLSLVVHRSIHMKNEF